MTVLIKIEECGAGDHGAQVLALNGGVLRTPCQSRRDGSGSTTSMITQLPGSCGMNRRGTCKSRGLARAAAALSECRGEKDSSACCGPCHSTSAIASGMLIESRARFIRGVTLSSDLEIRA